MKTHIFLGTILICIAMTVYQTVKFVIFPNMTLFQSNVITIVFTTILGSLILMIFLKKYHQLNKKLLKEIRQHQLAEESLKNSKERFETLIETMNEGVLTVDKEGNLRYLNPMMCSLLGYEKEELLGRSLFSLLDEENKKILAKQLERRKRGYGNRYELAMLRKNGGVIHTLVSGQPIFDQEGSHCGSFGIFLDITDRIAMRKMKEQFFQCQKMQAIGTLAGGIAHDFNNILGAIVGFASLTLHTSPAEDVRRNYQEQILQAANRARDLVRQILAFSRKNIVERKIPIQIQGIIPEVLRMLQPALPETVEVKQEIDTDCRIFADETQMHQILVNLCTNASQAMGEKGGSLYIGASEVMLASEIVAVPHNIQPGHYLQLKISDTGCGMDSATTARIFEPYFTTKEVGVGSGLGLAVVHGIVEGHGGAIQVFSQPGEGTTFKIFLPVLELETELQMIENRLLDEVGRGSLIEH